MTVDTAAARQWIEKQRDRQRAEEVLLTTDDITRTLYATLDRYAAALDALDARDREVAALCTALESTARWSLSDGTPCWCVGPFSGHQDTNKRCMSNRALFATAAGFTP